MLDRYFAQLNSGISSSVSFSAAFGMTPADLWQRKLRDYAEQIPVVTRDFDPRKLDTAFSSTPAIADELEPILRYLADKADADRAGNVGIRSTEVLNGSWDRLSLDGQCRDPLTFSVDPVDGVVSIADFYSEPGDPAVPALFSADSLDDGAFRLLNITATAYPNVRIAADFHLSIKSDNVFCLDQEPVRRFCESIFQRCDAGRSSLD